MCHPDAFRPLRGVRNVQGRHGDPDDGHGGAGERRTTEAARALNAQLAKQQKALTAAWEKAQDAATTYTAEAEKLEHWRLDRLDSMVAKTTQKPTWQDIQRTSKRKTINPKGQR